jgi:hypothetical protein
MQVNQPQNPQDWIQSVSKPKPSPEAEAMVKSLDSEEMAKINVVDQKKIISGILGQGSNCFKILDTDPRELVDKLRNSKGPDRDDRLLSFQKELDQMNKKELTMTRDYLIESMADPTNKDDAFLGVLLKVVNRELDSRQNWPGFEPTPFPPKPFPPRPPRPLPIDPNDLIRKLDKDTRLD